MYSLEAFYVTNGMMVQCNNSNRVVIVVSVDDRESKKKVKDEKRGGMLCGSSMLDCHHSQPNVACLDLSS